ncbi:MAG: hypothetical protein ACOCR8_00630 [Desulfosalsimonas sp.]
MRISKSYIWLICVALVFYANTSYELYGLTDEEIKIVEGETK